MSPRVLIANSLLVPDWATWEEFWELEAAGLTMYGQMTAGSWIYIGTQGILQGTHQTFAAIAEQKFGWKSEGQARWVALSGEPDDIAATDRAVAKLFPDNRSLQGWLEMAKERVAFQGLPSRICWLGYGERHKAGLAFNELVRSGEVKAPIVIGRDHLDSGSVASPYRETESMKDGSDAIADWPILNALLNTASGAAWVAVHHGGGVGMGKSIHAGAQVVADGTDEGAERVERVLTNDPGTGVMRHVDAGYERAAEVARERNVQIPMQSDE